MALEQKIEPHDFRLFINEFANNLFPSYDKASGSGNVKAKQVQMRLRVMFLAFCKHFGLNAEEIRSPFSEEIDLYEGIVPDDDLFPEEAPSFEEVSDSEETGGLVFLVVFRDDENAQTEEEPLSSDGGDNLPEAGETHEED